MESAHIGLIIIGENPKRKRIAKDIKETLHLDLLSTTKDLNSFIKTNPLRGYIFENPSLDKINLEKVTDWSRKYSFEVVFFILADKIKQKSGNTYYFDSQLPFKQLSEEIFNKISELCFQEPGLAKKYFYFRNISQKLSIPHIIVSGACSYLYYGKRSLKDIDLIIPSKSDLGKLSKITDIPVIKSDSSCASMYYMNLKEVDVNSEVEVFWENCRVKFDFNELIKDAKSIPFLGVSCLVMSPEDLIIFKFCLARFGIDDFNDYKDDFEDVRGVIISQPINWEKLHKKAIKMGALERVKAGERLLGLFS